jgi:hypothetical protein
MLRRKRAAPSTQTSSTFNAFRSRTTRTSPNSSKSCGRTRRRSRRPSGQNSSNWSTASWVTCARSDRASSRAPARARSASSSRSPTPRDRSTAGASAPTSAPRRRRSMSALAHFADSSRNHPEVREVPLTDSCTATETRVQIACKRPMRLAAHARHHWLCFLRFATPTATTDCELQKEPRP